MTCMFLAWERRQHYLGIFLGLLLLAGVHMLILLLKPEPSALATLLLGSRASISSSSSACAPAP